MKYVSQWYRQVMGLSPRKKKILLICLWCVAPIEMGIITGAFYLGKRLHQKSIEFPTQISH
jgi:hypothetical protein